MIALFGCLIQNIAEIAKPCAQGHHMAFPQTVDRRVCDLREILPEEVMQSAIAVGQNSQRRVIAHGPDRFLARLGHRMQDQFKIFHGPASHQLAAARIQRVHFGRGLAAILCQQRVHLLRPARPLSPIALASQFGLQRIIREHFAACQINAHHLAGADPATFNDTVFRHHNHASFRSGNHQPVIGDHIAHRTQAIPVKTSNHPVVGIGRNCGRSVPWLHHRIAIGIQLCKLAITADINGSRYHHGLHHGQRPPAMSHQLEHSVEGG